MSYHVQGIPAVVGLCSGRASDVLHQHLLLSVGVVFKVVLFQLLCPRQLLHQEGQGRVGQTHHLQAELAHGPVSSQGCHVVFHPGVLHRVKHSSPQFVHIVGRGCVDISTRILS